MGIVRRIRTGMILTGLAAALTFGATTNAARAETLADALAYSYRHSGLLDQNRALLRAADEDVAQAMSQLRPIVNWSATLERSFGNTTSAQTGFTSAGISTNSLSVGLTAQLVLYDGGRSALGVEIAKESVLGTREALLSLEQQVLLRAAQAYLEVRRNAEFVSLRNNNVRLITQELRAARERFDVGEVTRTDVALAEARLAAAKSGLAASQGGLARAQLEFVAAVGRKPGRLYTPSPLRRLPTTRAAAENIALRGHPDMARARREVKIADLRVSLADRAYQPSVTLNGRLALSDTLGTGAHSQTGSIGVTASGPIYNGGRLASVQRQAMQASNASRAALHVTSHSIRQNVGNALASLEVARASSIAGQQQVRAARVAFRGVREEATLGSRTTLDVLNAEQELLDAQANLISAQVDELIAGYALLATMGELTAQKLRLNVELYDPAGYYNLVKDAPAGRSEQGKRLDRVLRRIGNE